MPATVELSAAIGPENPPCPACGAPLFGWVSGAEPGDTVRRCERCGLGVVGEPAGREDAAAALGTGQRGGRIANRASLQASFGRAGWAAIEPGTRYLFTVEAVRLLSVDGVETRWRWAAGAGIATMWRTLLNGFTFGRNSGLDRIGRGRRASAGRRWQRRLDSLISAVLALPLLLIAVPLESAAALLGRGGVLEPAISRAASRSSQPARARR